MASNFDSGAPRDGFNTKARVTLSQAAREVAIAFINKVGDMRPKQDFIVMFDWADSRRVRFPRDSNNWQELGAGIDLGVCERGQVPLNAVMSAEELEFAVKIDERILVRCAERIIDVDRSTSPPQLVIR